MQKVDLKKELKHLYNAPTKAPVVIDVPPMNFLLIDGVGDPNTSPAFQAAVEALYSVAYTLKFSIKKGPLAIDYPVMPLEGLWWMDDMGRFALGNKDDWKWTVMLVQPDFMTEDLVKEGVEQVRKKRNLAALPLLRFERFHEGLCAQIMHLGPYAAEKPTIERLHAFIAEQGASLTGKHHEIYLSDPSRTAPEKMKTVIRQPMKRT